MRWMVVSASILGEFTEITHHMRGSTVGRHVGAKVQRLLGLGPVL